MSAFINTAMLRTSTFESGALGVLASIIHPLSVGEYDGEVLQGKAIIGQFSISIVEESEASSVQVDLHMIAGPLANGLPRKYRAAAADDQPGYVVFYVSKGEGGFQVMLKEKGKAVFDSRLLQPSDMYAVTLVRPGRYEMSAGKKSSKGRIDVKPVTAKAEPRQEPGTATVAVNAKGLVPNMVTIEAGGSVIFALAIASSIAVAFEGGDKSIRRPASPIRVYNRDHQDIEARVDGKSARRGRQRKA